MYIHVVQPADTINSIADYYGVSVTSLIRNNGLLSPYNLVPGQTIVVVYPQQVHTVAYGDSITGIAAVYGVSPMQLLRNNPFLSGGDNLYPGETIIISYETGREILTNGFAYQYINLDTLRRTLPYLTYLSVYNYRATGQGEIISYYDDSEIIRMAKEYGTAPLLMLTTLTTQGEPNPQIAFDILTNEEYQENFIRDMLGILKARGFYGINIFYNYMTSENREIYENFTAKVSDSLKEEGYLLLITINPNINISGNEIYNQIVDYSIISQPVSSITFINMIWGTNYGPPLPVISIDAVRQFLGYVTANVSPDLISLGIPVIGYDWGLPYETGRTNANALTINAALTLADDEGAMIQFDEVSQTPFFFYNQYNIDEPQAHIVRFIDARTIDGFENLVTENGLSGISVWNIMVFYEQLWLIINSRYQIKKIIPDNLQL